LIIPNATSIRIAAITANGKNCNALENKNKEKMALKSPTIPHEILLVAPLEIFIPVLTTSALAGNHQTAPLKILVIPSQ
jgi:hypothetical protein